MELLNIRPPVVKPQADGSVLFALPTALKPVALADIDFCRQLAIYMLREGFVEQGIGRPVPKDETPIYYRKFTYLAYIALMRDRYFARRPVPRLHARSRRNYRRTRYTRS